MSMLFTTIGFLAVTAACILYHLKRTGIPSAKDSRPAAATGPPCMRCGAAVPAESAFCPGCGVPVQAFEVVSAAAVTVDAQAGGAKHAVVRADLCVGCPEVGAIRMEGKLAVVERSKCMGHGDCEAACPVGGILISTGAAVHRVQVPQTSGSFETNIEGMYIAGELGGRGLIKNAINEGKIAVEDVVQRVRSCGPRPVSNGDLLDLIVVGAGPAGLSAGLEALKSGLKYVVLEQGGLADTIRKYPRKKILLAEPIRVPLYGDLWIADASKETLLQVWETIIANTGLDVKTNHQVVNVAREGDAFVVKAGDRLFRGRHVVLAMGRRGTPRQLGVQGESSDKVFYDIVEMEQFQGKKVIVVGGGDSAVESALGLANQEGTSVLLSYRGDRFKRVKERNLEKLKARIAEKKIHLAFNSNLRDIGPDRVAIDIDGESRILPNDDVIIRIGGEPPFGFLEKIGVRIVQKDVPLPDSQAANG
jgi:thioredoxin reductase